MALERNEGCLIAGEERHPSFGVTDNEMKCRTLSVLHKNCQSPGVIVCGYQLGIPPFHVEIHRAQAGARIRHLVTCALPSEEIAKVPGTCRCLHWLQGRGFSTSRNAPCRIGRNNPACSFPVLPERQGLLSQCALEGSSYSCSQPIILPTARQNPHLERRLGIV